MATDFLDIVIFGTYNTGTSLWRNAVRQALQFPIEYPDWGNGQLEITFEPLAIPPRHDLVSSVFGWVF